MTATGKDQITRAMLKVWSKGRVNAAAIYRDWDYSGRIKGQGWWVCSLNGYPRLLGETISEALWTIRRFGTKPQPGESPGRGDEG